MIRNEELCDLMLKAIAAFEAMTPDEQVHYRHEQRISFAYGNVALSMPDDADFKKLRDDVRKMAGPCSCTTCQFPKTWMPIIGNWCTIQIGTYTDRIGQIIMNSGLVWQVRINLGEHGSTEHWYDKDEIGPPPDGWKA